jgi:hypothetical protein
MFFVLKQQEDRDRCHPFVPERCLGLILLLLICSGSRRFIGSTEAGPKAPALHSSPMVLCTGSMVAQGLLLLHVKG